MNIQIMAMEKGIILIRELTKAIEVRRRVGKARDLINSRLKRLFVLVKKAK